MKNLVRFVGILVVAILAATQAKATVLGSDTFSYSDGDLPTQSGGTWATFSGTTGAGDVQVTSGQAQTSGARTGDDGFNYGGTHTSEAIFAAFDATVVSWAPTSSTGYFALLKDASTFNFFARTYVTNVVGGVQFGITTGATQPPIWSSTVSVGSTHRLVIELDETGPSLGVNMVASLYMDGTLVGSSYSIINSNYNITAFALRESNASSMGTVNVDNLVVGNSFADVIPEPSTIVLLGAGLAGLLALRRRS